MEIDDETNEMGASNDSSEFNAEMLSLPATSSSSSLTTLDESSCSSDENITHACKCATFVRQPNLADNVFYRCLAQDMRYGIYYPCSQRAQLVLACGIVEKFYCEMHATMFHDHRQCQHCRTFCYQGNFMVCTEGDVDHWMDRACFRTMNRRCAHCDSLGPHIERWNFHPERFVDIRPNFENLALAINRGNVRAVNVLLYHGAPLHANNSGMEMDNLLNYALDLHKLNVADEILKCASAYEGFIMAKMLCKSAYVTRFFVDAINVEGQTATNIACQSNNWDIAK
ncbi:hypothetical protein Tcan_03788 [Toxocara canis]|uniref:EHMT1/2 cysteine-rich region domain-containing protein n=1 Tax=Toxocara canis TaxID=6265 RepID=A0A0B2VZ28_TOXCA|nr:hypothetical protein Tcan_03788 [Toxocara canis]